LKTVPENILMAQEARVRRALAKYDSESRFARPSQSNAAEYRTKWQAEEATLNEMKQKNAAAKPQSIETTRLQ
jgi:hypothetical protein